MAGAGAAGVATAAADGDVVRVVRFFLRGEVVVGGCSSPVGAGSGALIAGIPVVAGADVVGVVDVVEVGDSDSVAETKTRGLSSCCGTTRSTSATVNPTRTTTVPTATFV